MFLAEKGDTVTVHYTVAFKNGAIFDTTRHKKPISFTLGDGYFIPGFEAVILGMSVGQVKTVTVDKSKAFGQKFPDLIQTISRDAIPDHIHCTKGQCVEITLKNNQKLVANITHVTETEVTLDANLPQSGQDFVVTVELVNLS